MGTGLDANKNGASVDMLSRAYMADKESFLVHRLDRVTSGLMCLAKSKEMARVLSAEMSSNSLTKEYTALLCSYSLFFPFP